jgi:RimJ/RimL family protein N-acetyltransferase
MIKTLETERLILRGYREDDFEAVRSYMNCVEGRAYLPWGANADDEAWAYIDLAMGEAEKTLFSIFIMRLFLKKQVK